MVDRRKIPAWLERQLADAGHLDTDGHSRKARTGYCPRCHEPVSRGLDWHILGLPTTVDIAPLDNAGELAALLLGRTTYELGWVGRQYEINRRDHWRIQGKPPETNGVHVVAEHQCGQPLAPPMQPADPEHTTSNTPQF